MRHAYKQLQSANVMVVGVLAFAAISLGVGRSGLARADGPAGKASAASPPVITVEEQVHDFGKVWSGDKLLHSFKITNTGGAPLKIVKLQPACGCTSAGEYPSELAPGESGLFPFSLKSNKLRGRFSKTITVKSNDPATPALKLKLQGNCTARIEVKPSAIRFKSVVGGASDTSVAKITNHTGQPLELELDGSSADGPFTFSLIEKVAGKEFELHVSVATAAKAGVQRASANMRTNLKALEIVSLPVSVRVVDRLEVIPSELKIRPPRKTGVRAGDPTTKTLHFFNHGDSPVQVLEATVDDPKLTATVTPRKDGKGYDIRLEFPGSYRPPPGGCLLTVKTDDAQVPTIQVPIKRSEIRTARRKPARKLATKNGAVRD